MSQAEPSRARRADRTFTARILRHEASRSHPALDRREAGIRYRRSAMASRPSPVVAPEECCDAPAPVGSVDVPDDAALAALGKALGHPVRVKILRILASRQACVTGDVVAALPLAQSTVSEHLRVLREAGLVQGEIEGPRTRYCINTAGLAALKAGVASL